MGLKNKVQALIDYANETTGKGDTLLGNAVKTLCDGYGGHEAEVEGTFMQRTTADGLSIKDASKAKAVSIKGNTWVRNQMVNCAKLMDCVIGVDMAATASCTIVKGDGSLIVTNNVSPSFAILTYHLTLLLLETTSIIMRSGCEGV